MLPQLPTSTSAHPMGSETLLPKVLKYHSNFYYVEAEGVLYECFVKGILKKEGIEILVGDSVVLDNLDQDSGQGRIVEVLERTNVLTRPKIANIHQAIIVHPLEEPAFSPAQLDRYLTHVELAGLDPIICISKCDLAKTQDQLEEIKALYHAKLGYPILFTSVHHPNSLAPLVEMTRGKVSVLAGLSGAGKSSLLNFLKPSLKLKTQEVSEKISRGQHTTRHVELIEIAEATYIADTPGFSNLKFDYTLPETIQGVFRDFPLALETLTPPQTCEFSDCLHLDEEGCLFRELPPLIHETRMQSYLDMMAEAKLFETTFKNTSQKEAFGFKMLNKKGKESTKVLRLKEKSRELSRRRLTQNVQSTFDEETEDTL